MRRDIGDYFIGESRINSEKESYFIVGKVVGRFCEGVLIDYYSFDFDNVDYRHYSHSHCGLDYMLQNFLFINEDVWERCELIFKDRDKVDLKLDISVLVDFLNSKNYLPFYEELKQIYGKKS